jgi:hypothetical protein
VWDVDGNAYLDYVCTWGPAILGHAHPGIIKAVQQAAENGTSFGIPNPLEVTMAKFVCAAVPAVEKVRMRMAENGRSPGADVVDVIVAIDIEHPRALGSVHEKRLAADRAKRAHRRVHAAGNVFQSLGKKFFRLNTNHAHNLTNGRLIPHNVLLVFSEEGLHQRASFRAGDRAGADVVSREPALRHFEDELNVVRIRRDARLIVRFPQHEG